jgi:hypothetical protein
MVQGEFFGFEEGPFANDAIVPVTFANPTNTPGAFTINADGSVTVNVPGLYLVISRLQVEVGSSTAALVNSTPAQPGFILRAGSVRNVRIFLNFVLDIKKASLLIHKGKTPNIITSLQKVF